MMTLKKISLCANAATKSGCGRLQNLKCGIMAPNGTESQITSWQHQQHQQHQHSSWQHQQQQQQQQQQQPEPQLTERERKELTEEEQQQVLKAKRNNKYPHGRMTTAEIMALPVRPPTQPQQQQELRLRLRRKTKTMKAFIVYGKVCLLYLSYIYVYICDLRLRRGC